MAQLNQFRVRRFALSIPALPRTLDGTTIAHVSDMHVGILSGVQALYAEDQAKSARRQADAAELANTREELTALNMAEPKFEWMPPTGSRDGIDISSGWSRGLSAKQIRERRSGAISLFLVCILPMVIRDLTWSIAGIPYAIAYLHLRQTAP